MVYLGWYVISWLHLAKCRSVDEKVVKLEEEKKQLLIKYNTELGKVKFTPTKFSLGTFIIMVVLLL